MPTTGFYFATIDSPSNNATISPGVRFDVTGTAGNSGDLGCLVHQVTVGLTGRTAVDVTVKSDPTDPKSGTWTLTGVILATPGLYTITASAKVGARCPGTFAPEASVVVAIPVVGGGGVQTDDLVMAALGVVSDPVIQPGIHLRWWFQPALDSNRGLGYPDFGFDIRRRTHRLGAPHSLNFVGQPSGPVTSPAHFGPTTWTASDPSRKMEFVLAPTHGGTQTALTASTLTTCVIAVPGMPVMPVRRIEIDLLHWNPPQPTSTVQFWGTWGSQRVAATSVTLNDQNLQQILTVVIEADRLDGFQTLLPGWAQSFGILAIRWIPVMDEVGIGWDTLITARPIGLPITTPGYGVSHAHSPDDGSGLQDWAEAADRMSPTGTASGLPSPLATRFGPPTFTNKTRDLMMRAINRLPLSAVPQTAEDPQADVSAISVTEFAAIDPDFARLLGLGMVDRTAQVGTEYDYLLLGHWAPLGTGDIGWICFNVTRASLPAVHSVGPLTGQAMPGFAAEGRPEELVGLTIEQPQPNSIVRLPTDPLTYWLQRRSDGDAPNPSPTGGTWDDLNVDPSTGSAQPILWSISRPDGHQTPPGWPADPPHYIDDTIDPTCRYYSYRAQGGDIFGRVSDWCAPLSVDAADTTAPPAPASIVGRYLDPTDPWLSIDDIALLSSIGGPATRLRWSWTRRLSQQAPDAARFRVYWNSYPFTTAAGTITAISTTPAAYSAVVNLSHQPASLPANAFSGDWLRQGVRQWLIQSSTLSNPSTLTVSALDIDPPTLGLCSLSLRGPDPQKLDLLGNPLRPDPTSALIWEQRVQQGAVGIATGTVASNTVGGAVTIHSVTVDAPRAGYTTLAIDPTLRWGGGLPPMTMLLQAGGLYSVVGAILGDTATLVVATPGIVPTPGTALLLDEGQPIWTIQLNAPIPDVTPFQVVGGTVWTGMDELPVLAHGTGPNNTTVLVVSVTSGPSDFTDLTWYPDHETLLSGLALPVTPQQPHATGVAGVSAVDNRSYAVDARARPGEPTAPGNEGPVASLTIRKEYRGAPTSQPVPGGPGAADLWASVPDQFSGTSRFALNWPATGDYGFIAYRATLDAILDADQADRGAGRGAYVGQPPLSGPALDQWRAQQALLLPTGLQQLATAQPSAFVPIPSRPLIASDPDLQDNQQAGWLRWLTPIDGAAPGRHFMCLRAVDEAGNQGPLGPATLPIRVPDVRRPFTPRLRRVQADDRAVWILWTAADAEISYYRLFRSQLDPGSTPDVRDMTEVASFPPDQCPQPLSVSGQAVRLPAGAPDSVVAIYAASLYDPTKGPTAQLATPLGGTFTVSGTTVAGLVGIADGTQVYVVVIPSPGAAPILAAAASACGYLDDTVSPWTTYQYRLVSGRYAEVGSGALTPVESLPTPVGEATPFNASRPVPPDATALWLPVENLIRISWLPGNVPASWQVLLQRLSDPNSGWSTICDWRTSTVGSIDDPAVQAGASYSYRLRVRDQSGRTNSGQSVIGPISVP